MSLEQFIEFFEDSAILHVSVSVVCVMCCLMHCSACW